MASILITLREGKNARLWQSISQRNGASTPLCPHRDFRQQGRFMAFKPRRTPPASIAGVNLRPRPNPITSFLTPFSGNKKQKRRTAALGGQGRKEDWISPHHKDYYGRVDDSTLDHPELLHGDPHMPVQRFARGDGRVVLDPLGRRAKDLNDYANTGWGDSLVAILDEYKNLDEYLAMDGCDEAEDEEDSNSDDDEYGDELVGSDEEEGDDDLEREFGSDAADAIRQHLHSFRTRLDSARVRGSKSYSPLDELEEKLRSIDRLTSMENTTQDLALKRRSRTEAREFFRLGTIPKCSGRSGGDSIADEFEENGEIRDGSSVTDGEREFGMGRGYDAQSVFGKGAKVHFPYSKGWPSPTYHPDFPKGSNVGNNPKDEDESKWMHELNRLISEEQTKELELGELDDTYEPVNVQKEDIEAYTRERERTKRWDLLGRDHEHEKEREEKPDEILEMIKNGEDPNQEAFGPWGECTIKVDRVQKVERGGTTVRYRALVIGGNGNGAAGFGIAKALSPNEAIVKACKHCKRNVFYVDRYLGSGLSFDLAGKHNSCKVHLRAVHPDYGLHGHPLIMEILKYAGISDATGKSHGNRNPYNVVYATFKALLTHESLEEIAMKRGKKLLNLQRARRLGVS